MTERAKRTHLERKVEALERTCQERGREITELKAQLSEPPKPLPKFRIGIRVVFHPYGDDCFECCFEWSLYPENYDKSWETGAEALAAARKFLKDHNLEEETK